MTSAGFQEKGNALSGKCRRSFALADRAHQLDGRSRIGADVPFARRVPARAEFAAPHRLRLSTRLLDELHGLFMSGSPATAASPASRRPGPIDRTRTQILGLAQFDAHHDVARRVALRGERLASSWRNASEARVRHPARDSARAPRIPASGRPASSTSRTPRSHRCRVRARGERQEIPMGLNARPETCVPSMASLRRVVKDSSECAVTSQRVVPAGNTSLPRRVSKSMRRGSRGRLQPGSAPARRCRPGLCSPGPLARWPSHPS